MKQLLSIIIILISFHTANAQSDFFNNGMVEYEYKINMNKVLEDQNDSWTKSYLQNNGNYSTQFYNLYFNTDESMFKKGKTHENKWDSYLTWYGYHETNFTHTNFKKNVITQFKNIYDKPYLLNDTVLNIDWRLTDETREIAGFTCRKAVGRFNDSLYVVGFYTDQIISSAGPLSFNGLPGLILGIAFPRFNYTIFATKVVLKAPTALDFSYNVKKPINTTRKELENLTKELSTRWENKPENTQKAINNVLFNN